MAQFSGTASVFNILMLKLPTILFAPLLCFTESIFCDKASWQSTISVMKRLYTCQKEEVAWLKVCGAFTSDGKLNYWKYPFSMKVKRLCSLHSWKFSGLNQMKPWAAWSELIANLTWLLRLIYKIFFKHLIQVSAVHEKACLSLQEEAECFRSRSHLAEVSQRG